MTTEHHRPARVEVCFLIGNKGRLLWRDVGRAYALSDSRERWDAIWENRNELREIAHSHPHGPLAFSEEDRTTMQAIWSALGRNVIFSVVTATAMIRTSRGQRVRNVWREPTWVHDLRRASGCEKTG